MSNVEKFSDSLEIAGGASESDHVVFLGLYNADAFRTKMEHWLPRLDMRGAALLVSDNASTDSTLEWLIPLVESLGVKYSVTQNQKNLGGYGNLASNLEAMGKVKWVTTLHQDDVYQSGHIQAHRYVLQNASPNLGMVFSEARSVDANGRMIPFPRAHWLLGVKSDPIKVFLAHLRHHVYPFSGATFAMEVLKRYPIPYGSTAFPDTELIMKMIVDFEVTQAQGVTVDYLENPISESHVLDSRGRDLGSYQALIRVFTDSNFEQLCKKLPKDKLPAFARALASGINVRFENQSMASLLLQAAFEITQIHLEARASDSLENREQLSRSQSSDQPLELERLGREEISPKSLNMNQIQIKSINGRMGISRSSLLKLAKIVPRSVRRTLFIQLMSTPSGKRLFPQWNFDWDQL